MNGLQAVEDLALYLHENLSLDVFKFEKPVNFQKEEYIVVNHLPFTFGRSVNAENVLNVNAHVKTLSSGNANILRLTELLTDISNLLPFDMEQEELVGINLKGSYYSITSISQPIEDTDGTYFLNIRVKVVINELNL